MHKMANCSLQILVLSILAIPLLSKKSCATDLDCNSIFSSHCSLNECVPCHESNQCLHISSSSICQTSQSSFCSISCYKDSDCSIIGGFCSSGTCQECTKNSDCPNELLCMPIGTSNRCGDCQKDSECLENQKCEENRCIISPKAIEESLVQGVHQERNLQITVTLFVDNKYTVISIIMISIYSFCVLVGGSILMYCEDDSSFVFRQYTLIQSLVSVLFYNVSYNSTGFTSLLSVLNVASSFTFFPNLFSLFLDYNFTDFKFYANFATYGFSGLILRDLGGLMWALLWAAIMQGVAIWTKPSAPPFSKGFEIFGFKTYGKLLIFGAYQISQIIMLQLINAVFNDGVQIVSWVLSLLFFIGYVGLIGYLAYLEYQLYYIKSPEFKASKREKKPYIYGDLRPNDPLRIRPILLALLTKNFFLGFLLVVTYDVEYLQIVVQFVVGLFYLALIAYYKPYKTNLILGMEIVNEIGVFLTRLLVLIYEASGETDLISGMDLLIWVLLAMGFIYSVYQPVVVLIRRSKGTHQSQMNQNALRNNQVIPSNKPTSLEPIRKLGSTVTNENKLLATDIGNDSSLITEQPSGFQRALSIKGKPEDKANLQNLESPRQKAPISRQPTLRESTDKNSLLKPTAPDARNIGSNLVSPKTTLQQQNSIITPQNQANNGSYSRQATFNNNNQEFVRKESTVKENKDPVLTKREVQIESLTSPKTNGITPENKMNTIEGLRFSFQKEEKTKSELTEPAKIGINQFLQGPKFTFETSKKSVPSLERPRKSEAKIEKPTISPDNSFTALRQNDTSTFEKPIFNDNNNSFLDESNNRSYLGLNESIGAPLRGRQAGNDKFIAIHDASSDNILPGYILDNTPQNRSPPPYKPANNNNGSSVERKPYPPDPQRGEFNRSPVNNPTENNRAHNQNPVKPIPILQESNKPPEKINISDLIQNIRNKRENQRSNVSPSPDRGVVSADVTNTMNFSRNQSNSDRDQNYAQTYYSNPNQRPPRMEAIHEQQEGFNTLDPQRYLDPRGVPDPYRDVRDPRQTIRSNNMQDSGYTGAPSPKSTKSNPFKFARNQSNYSDFDSRNASYQPKGTVHDSTHISYGENHDNGDPYRGRGDAYPNPYSGKSTNSTNDHHSGYRSSSQPHQPKKLYAPPSNSESEYGESQKNLHPLQHDDSDYYIKPNYRNPQGAPDKMRNIQNEYMNPNPGDRYSSVGADRRYDNGYGYENKMTTSAYNPRNASPDEMERSSEDISTVNTRLYANANARGELSPNSKNYEKAKLQNALKNLDDIKAWINAKNQQRTPTSSDSRNRTYGDRFRVPTDN